MITFELSMQNFLGYISCLHVRTVNYVSKSCIVYCTNQSLLKAFVVGQFIVFTKVNCKKRLNTN